MAKQKTVKESSVVISHIVMPTDANLAGNVHGGVIMKHIDNAAGIVAHRHTRTNVVTASIDRLDFHKPAYIGELLSFKAGINYVGRSSMEIGVRVEAESLLSEGARHIASAYLTFVSLDENHKPKQVPELLLETEDEIRRNREAQERMKNRYCEKQREKGN